MTKVNKKSAIEESVEQFTSYLHGDPSHVTVNTVVLDDPPEYKPEDIKMIRQKAGATQRVLAEMLAVSPRTVEAWEVGRTKPTGSARRLLQLVDENPKLLQPMA
ncbi:helix-turn-helix domain-containing protein [Schleiferilactobacillus shenzhenensis]|nr:helix-turn-helix domain-containing protein [Schleiferilactobacillus shenzhenensis]